MLGVMFDCSRNAVMTVDTLKKYADILKKMGYDTIMLYIEDTYEIKGHPYFGHLRGKYTQEELKEMDKYCSDIGMELIPCIQTLAHLEAIFKWSDVYTNINDCDSILLASDENTYKLIDDMLCTLSKCFTSKKIHVGMDEAVNVGNGKYRALHGVEDRFDIINNHLHRVCEIASKYDLEPMIWSDMFCQLALNIEDQYDSADASKILEKADLPENVSLVYWDYYRTDYNHYVEHIKTNQMFNREVSFAGGAWAWKGLAPDNDFSMRTTKAALDACRDTGVENVIFTVWGDDGNECPKAAIFPSLMYAAEVYRGNNDMNIIKEKFQSIVGCSFDDFMLLDKLDWVDGEHTRDCMSKNFLYSDVFMGIWDYHCKLEYSDFYKEIAEKLSSVTNKGDYAFLFDCYKAFSDVLEIKATLGIETRKAYLENNKNEILNICKKMDEVCIRIDTFHDLYKKAWLAENKSFGYEIMDIRFGGLKQRITSCKKTPEQFVSAEIKNIPELEEPVLKKTNGVFWSRLVSAGRISMYL